MRLRIVLLALALTLVLQSFVSAGNYFDGREQNLDTTIRGAKADIKTCPEPDLHGGTYSCAFSMVANSNSTRYAQAGYSMNSGEQDLVIFAEWRYANGTRDFTETNPPGSGTHTYTCIQDGGTGDWTFKYDSTTIDTTTNTAWAGCRAVFCGEVVPNTSVQMVGDATHRVKFITFRYLPAGCTSWATVWPSSPHNDNPDDWERDDHQADGYFEIWDTTP